MRQVGWQVSSPPVRTWVCRQVTCRPPEKLWRGCHIAAHADSRSQIDQWTAAAPSLAKTLQHSPMHFSLCWWETQEYTIGQAMSGTCTPTRSSTKILLKILLRRNRHTQAVKG